MNNVQLLGNLVRDVELRYTQSGSSVATFTVAATSVSYEAQDGTKRYVTEVVADFCTGQEPQQGSQAQATSNFDSMTTSHEEIPF